MEFNNSNNKGINVQSINDRVDTYVKSVQDMNIISALSATILHNDRQIVITYTDGVSRLEYLKITKHLAPLLVYRSYDIVIKHMYSDEVLIARANTMFGDILQIKIHKNNIKALEHGGVKILELVRRELFEEDFE